jgi:hypothetical protein
MSRWSRLWSPSPDSDSGPESMHGGVLLAAAYAVGVLACLAAPIAGFVFNGRGKTGAGVLVAWLPPAGALLAFAIPAPY